MPIIQSAKKRMKQERKRAAFNKQKRLNLKNLIKKVRINKSSENLAAVFSSLDKAAKTGLIRKNKANRLKSRLSEGIQASTEVIKKSTKKRVVRNVAKK